MEQGDLAVLRLLEALLETLPVLLLQAYTCVVMEANGLVSGLSAGMSLLSLSWALVSYSRSMCLIKPCHLSMPGTALLCQLLWRTGMIGTRVMTLVLFARTYHLWVFAAAGIHWLVMSYWTVAQQTDIFQNPCHWKLFNILTGAVYIFCYVNFKDGPSFCRMAVFYIITLSENVFLLLMSMDFLQVNSRSNLWILGAVISGSILGLVALVSYYSLLHPKSTEIWQRFLKRSHSLLSKGNKGNGNLTVWNSGIPGLQDTEASGAEPAIQPLAMPSNSSLVDFGCSADGKNLCENEHHWLLIKLALKTGSISKIKTVFGERDCCLVPVIKNNKYIVQFGPRRKLIFLTKEKFTISPKSRTGEQRSLTEENKVTDNVSESKEQFNITLPTSKQASVEATPAESNLEMEGDQKEPIYSCSTVYFTVGGEGEASPDLEGKMGAVNTRNVLTELAKTHKGSSMQSGRSGEDVLFTSADISPIVPTRTGDCLQNGPDFSASASPKPSDQQGMLRVHCNSSHAYLYRTWASVLKEKETRNATEQCCITSTPKNSSASNSHKH